MIKSRRVKLDGFFLDLTITNGILALVHLRERVVIMPNQQDDSYCFACHKEISPNELKQCNTCANWYCQEHSIEALDPDSLDIVVIYVCDADRGDLKPFS